MVELWTSGAGVPNVFTRRAAQAEADGWDGITIVDSQNLAGDSYVYLALAAKETSKLKLGTGVTNPVTRHPATTASAIMSVQAESNGRAMLGIGRGDSALAHLGYAPAKVEVFEDYIRRLAGYLRGDEVEFEAGGDVEKLRLANRPTSSRIRWPRGLDKVPLDVAATGPKVIAAAARHADRITFAVGSDPDRVRWGIETARAARSQAGFDPEMPFGAYVNVVAHPDPEVARRMGEGGMSLFVRFSAMHGATVGPASDEQKRVFETVHDSYDMTRHSRAGSPQAGVIPGDFAKDFAIFGPSQHCIARLQELLALGLDRLVIVGGGGDDPEEARKAERRFIEEVMPALRGG